MRASLSAQNSPNQVTIEIDGARFTLAQNPEDKDAVIVTLQNPHKFDLLIAPKTSNSFEIVAVPKHK